MRPTLATCRMTAHGDHRFLHDLRDFTVASGSIDDRQPRIALRSIAAGPRFADSPVAERYAVQKMLRPGAQYVVEELSARAKSRRPSRRLPKHSGLPKRLQVPDLASIQVLSERRTRDTCVVALTVADLSGERYLLIRVFIHEAGEWRAAGGSEGLDRTVRAKHDPYLPLYAYADGRFVGGGRVNTTTFGVARVRLVWEDGYELEDKVENGIVLFLGARDSLEPATVEFLDQAGRVVGRHPLFVEER